MGQLEGNFATFVDEVHEARRRRRELSNELQCFTEKCDALERLKSYGLYERWRRQLDIHLCAGGSIERTNTIECLDAARGYTPAGDVTRLRQGLEVAQMEQTAFAAELHASLQKGGVLRAEIREAVPERLRLENDIAEQRQKADKWSAM